MPTPQKLHVYVDEAGDRGWGGRSSEVFVLSAVIVRAAEVATVLAALDGINSALERPPAQVLHWAENLREHADRKYVATVLRALPATFVNIIVCKPSLFGTGSALADPAYQYSYPVRRLLERVSWYARQRQAVAELHFAHVRRFKYAPLYAYLKFLSGTSTTIAWDHLKNGTKPKIEQPTQLRGLQVADLLAGTVYAATRSDRHGTYEPQYLETVAPRLWRGTTRKLTTYGLHFISGHGHSCADHYSWLPAL